MEQITDEMAKAYKKAKSIYRAIDHPIRRNILNYVETEKSVTEVMIQLRLPQSVTSAQLGILRASGLVTNRRNGKEILYQASPDRITQLLESANSIITIK